MEEKQKTNSKKKFDLTKLTKFQIYKLVLAGIVGILLLHFLITLWWVPRRDAGSPVLGDRMENIEQLENSWIRDTEAFGNDQSDVNEFSIFWNSGPVVYFNVEVNERVSRSDARSVATEIVAYFVDVSDGVAEDYNLQVVISRAGEDLRELRDENHAEVRAHTFAHQYALVEDILAHAEQYPTANNLNQVYRRLNEFRHVIIELSGEEGLAAMWERHGAVVELTAEQEDQLADQLGLSNVPSFRENRRISPTDMSRFPNFGVWNHNRGRIDWN